MFSKKVHYPVTLEIHQEDGAGRVFSTQAEVVHTQHAHLLSAGTERTPDAVEEGVGAYDEARFAGQPGPRLSAQGEGYPLQSHPLTVGAPSVDAGHVGQALGEDAALAVGFVAEELVDSHSETHRCAAPG
jgi:hypothetical protein